MAVGCAKGHKDDGEQTPEAGVQIHPGTHLTGLLIHSTIICETSTTCQAQHTGYRGELRGPSWSLAPSGGSSNFQ